MQGVEAANPNVSRCTLYTTLPPAGSVYGCVPSSEVMGALEIRGFRFVFLVEKEMWNF